MDQLSAIRAFARVVEAGNFTRAAESLNMPNATLSKQIKELESYLGVRLLQRTTRRVTVTPEGTNYYTRTARILCDLDDIDSSFNTARRNPQGKLRIGIGGSTVRDVLIPVLGDFLQRYPEIRIDLLVSDKSTDLISDNIDCVIRGGPLSNSSLVARPIGSARLITCAAPAYLAAFGTPETPEALCERHRLISYLSPQTGRPVPLRFSHQSTTLEKTPEYQIGINESNAHIAAGLAGLGIIQTFSYSVQQALQDGSLTEILHDWRPAPYPFHVVYPQNRHVTQRLRVFIDWLLASLPARLSAPATPDKQSSAG